MQTCRFQSITSKPGLVSSAALTDPHQWS